MTQDFGQGTTDYCESVDSNSGSTSSSRTQELENSPVPCLCRWIMITTENVRDDDLELMNENYWKMAKVTSMRFSIFEYMPSNFDL